MPRRILEVIEKNGSYEVKTRSVEEFGQKRSLLEVGSEEKRGKEAKVMERLGICQHRSCVINKYEIF